MAKKPDLVAAKARKQKMMLIVGGVILAGLVFLQGPKLMKQLKGSSTTAAPAAVDGSVAPTTDGSTAGTTTGGTTTVTTTPAVATGRGQTAQVAGIVIKAPGAPPAGTGQLWSLSRFKVKDPFVQQAQDTSGAGAAGEGTTASSPGTTTTPGGAVATPSTETPVALAYATLMVNGKPQQLALKQVFPKAQPTFVLVSVDKKFIKIGVAGGKFTGGGAVRLEFGKAVTLMNTTTGQRFVMKLVFTGAQPEQIAGFKQPVAAATTQPASTPTTTASQP